MTALISQRTRYRLICGYRVIATLEFGNTATFYLPPLIAAFEKARGEPHCLLRMLAARASDSSVSLSRVPVFCTRSAAFEVQGQLSPDGRWLAYSSDESGEYRVYVQSFPSPAAKWQVSVSGADQPRWREDGGELFYMREDGTLMAVEVKLDDRGERFGSPFPLFDTELQALTAIMAGGTFRPTRWHQYVVSPDGQRFLVNTPADELRRSPIEVATSWKAGTR